MSKNGIKIKLILDKLNIPYKGDFNSKGWLPILCPFHDDEHFGSASIRENGVISCFVCKKPLNLFKAVKLKYPKMNNKQVFEFLEEYNKKTIESVLKRKTEKRIQEQETIKETMDTEFFRLELSDVDLNWHYCKTREFTKKWIDKFEVKFVTKGYYEGYFVIPISFKNKVISYEFRKALEYERLLTYFPNDKNKSLEDLRKKFKESNLRDFYLSRPKVLYPKNVNEHKNILFNYDNCDLNKDIFICEGIAGTASIMKNVSENVVATFGSKITKSQLELLKTFKKRKYIVNDNDDAANSYIYSISEKIENCYVYPEKKGAIEYLIEKFGLFSFEIK